MTSVWKSGWEGTQMLALSEPYPIQMPGVLEVFQEKEPYLPSELAERYRSVTIGAHRGSWDNAVTPYLVEIMDAGAQPFIEELVICGTPQSGKTNACINILLWHIYRYGGNGKFIMFPTELLAKLFYRVRLVPILQGCSVLAGRMSPEPKDTTSEKVSLRDGTHLFPAWGNSAAKLSSFPADFVWADEIDKNNELTGDESDPLSLLEDRVRTARRRLSLKCSSPTLETGHIWKHLHRCQYRFERNVLCPHCDAEQVMQPDRITWPGQVGLFDKGEISQPDNDPELMKSMRLARYVCIHCGSLWNDLERNQAVRRGQWKTPEGQTIAEVYATRPRSVGFHIHGLICPDISLSDVAAEIIKARTGGESAEKRLMNSFLGLPWKPPQTAAVTESALLKYRSELPRNLVPPDTCRLVLMADTQQDSFYYQVWALGYAPTITMQMIRHGQVHRFGDLEGLLQANWQDHTGKTYRITGGLIDSGGTRRGYQKHSRTMEVYEWCSRNRQMLPIKGMHGRSGDLLSYKTIATYPGSNKAIQGGLTRVNIRVDLFKDEMERMMALEPDDLGAFQFHADIDEAFAKHYTTERKDEKGDWFHDKAKGRNDYFDCTGYALAYREMVKLHPDMTRRENRQQPPQTASTTPRPNTNYSLPGWMNNRG